MSVLDIVNLENFRKVFRNIRKVGLLTTIRYIVSDLLFDMKYRIDTINTEQLENLDIDSPNKQYGVYYEGTNAYIFKKTFSSFKVDAANSCFVDFGSGKGKAMFMAAERGFRKRRSWDSRALSRGRRWAGRGAPNRARRRGRR